MGRDPVGTIMEGGWAGGNLTSLWEWEKIGWEARFHRWEPGEKGKKVATFSKIQVIWRQRSHTFDSGKVGRCKISEKNSAVREGRTMLETQMNRYYAWGRGEALNNVLYGEPPP